MRVLVINPGSWSLKLAVVKDGQGVVSLTLHNWDGSPDQRQLRQISERAGPVVSLDRLDAPVFTGGVAEHQPGLRIDIAARLVLLGVAMDSRRNAAAGDRVVSPAHAEPQVLVVAAREDLEIARETTRALRCDSIGASNP